MTVRIDHFGNDGAADLLGEVRESPPEQAGEMLATALHNVIDVAIGDYLEKDYAEAAVAASALIAALRSGDDQVLERCELDADSFGSLEHLVTPALAALDRVVSGESELLNLWADEGEERSFLRSVESVASSLRGSLKP